MQALADGAISKNETVRFGEGFASERAGLSLRPIREQAFLSH